MTGPAKTAGGCLCGAVRYRVSGPLRPCHCGQCRRTSGHYAAATACRRSDLEIDDPDAATWYASPSGVRRGFCARCGSSLFWDREGSDTLSIFAGTLDQPSGLRLVMHIYTDHAGDYYEIADDLPRLHQGRHDIALPEA